MAGEAVPQHVRMHMGRQSGELCDPRQAQLHDARADATPTLTQEQRRSVPGQRLGAAECMPRCDPAIQGHDGLRPDGHAAPLAALAKHVDFPVREVDPEEVCSRP